MSVVGVENVVVDVSVVVDVVVVGKATVGEALELSEPGAALVRQPSDTVAQRDTAIEVVHILVGLELPAQAWVVRYPAHRPAVVLGHGDHGRLTRDGLGWLVRPHHAGSAVDSG